MMHRVPERVSVLANHLQQDQDLGGGGSSSDVSHLEASAPQSAVCSDLREFSLHLTLFLANDGTDCRLRCARHVAHKLQEMAKEIPLLTAVGFSNDVWMDVQQYVGVEIPPFPYWTRLGPLGDMPATGGDVFVHAKSDVYWHLVELTKQLLESLPEEAVQSVEDIYAFTYKDHRDLSGHIDGTANPTTVEERQHEVLDPYGGSFLLGQRWVHNFSVLRKLTDEQEERYVGRTKPDSSELDPMPETAHVTRMEIFYQDGPRAGQEIQVYRQSAPYGSFGAGAGLYFMQYSSSPDIHNLLLDRMTGQDTPDRIHNDIMRFTVCKTGNLWYVPSVEHLQKVASPIAAANSVER